MDDATFTRRFRRALRRNSLSVRVVAALMGVSRVTVSRYISGESRPHPIMRPLALYMVEG